MERNLRGELILAVAIVAVAAYVSVRQQQEATRGVAPTNPSVVRGTEMSDGFTPRSVRSTDRKGFGVPVTWSTCDIGAGYSMNVGTYKKYVVATEFVKDDVVVLRDYTPSGEYVVFMDPKHKNPMEGPCFCRAADGSFQLAFRHRSIYDSKLDAYMSYRATPGGLQLAEYKP